MKELSPEQVTDLIRHWDFTFDDPTADYPDTSPDATADDTDPSDLNANDSDVCWADAPTASHDVLFLDNNLSEHNGESDVCYLGDIQKEIRDYFDDPSDVTNQNINGRFSELKREGEDTFGQPK